ncbi:hypothetical protein [Neolewinella antarctica]|uniref:Uncharacterized protein n=1 Tax=Neolewinella antarctica TaxID=442734 RepID=A0ABX0XDY5_9BACT|nr:hypothetical protein [Neolewinella antarctica]NJC27124.1 hypothetical protein [Neolewinella antarctica]
MEGTPAKKSSARTLIYLILLGIAVLAVLQFAGIANVLGKAESEHIIDRPHDGDRR